MLGKPEHNINIIGTRHGEKLYETLLTREEMVHAVDMEGYYRIPADLNYGNNTKWRRIKNYAFKFNRDSKRVIVGTRPEIIKLSRVLAELEKYTNHILVHSGQNYEVFFNEMGIKKPDYLKS